MKTNNFFKRLLTVTLGMILLGTFLFTGCSTNNSDPSCTNTPSPPENTGTDYPGLYVAEDGYIYLGGTRFYGYGLCMYSTFQDTLANIKSKAFYAYDYSLKRSQAYKADFQFANQYNIPIIRVPFSSWGYEAYQTFKNNKDTFFSAMDQVVAEAEKSHVGIIASLMWNQDVIPFFVGEKRSDYGDAKSKTLEFAKEYVSAIVERYKDSPAIWGWEIGNEYNLCSDLASSTMDSFMPSDMFISGKKSYMDFYKSSELVVFYEEVGKEIRKYDSTRLITTGNGENRTFSYAAHQAAESAGDLHVWAIDWTLDTREQFMEMCAYFTPDPINTICFHFQHGSLGADVPFLTMTHNLRDESLTTAEYVKVYVEAGRRVKKGVYFGEFGDFIQIEDESNEYFDRDLFESSFKTLMDGMVDADLQIATGWFNWDTGSGRFNHTAHNLNEVNIYKMETLQTINNQFKADGKQNTEDYWSKYPCDGSSFGYSAE